MPKPNSQRIAYVVKRYPRYSETFIVNEILAHEAAGWEIDIFALRPPTDTHFQNRISQVRAPVSYLPSASVKGAELWKAIRAAASTWPGFWRSLELASGESALEVYQALQLADAIRLRGLDHLHAHFASSAASVARLAASLANVSFSMTAHAKDIFHQDVSPGDLRRKLTDSATTVTVSDFNVRYLQDTFGPAAKNVVRVYNGLDLEQFPFQRSRTGPPRLVAVGRLVPKKGFDVLVEAVRKVRDGGRSITCEIVGSGELETTLRNQIEDLNLGEVVELCGPQPQHDVIRRLQSATAFVAPCVVGDDGNRDGLPTVLLEAMASGTPCIATDVTGIPEIVRDGETGLVVSQNNADELASAIETLLDSPAKRSRLAENARALIEADFDIHRNSKAIRQLFREAMRVRVQKASVTTAIDNSASPSQLQPALQQTW